MAEEKLKILYLMQMLLEETDPAHPMRYKDEFQGPLATGHIVQMSRVQRRLIGCELSCFRLYPLSVYSK